MTRLNEKLSASSRRITTIAQAALLAGILAVPLLPVGTVLADQAPPKGNVGFKTLKSQIVDLGPEIDGMQGRQLRLRLLMIEPGGQIGIHTHADRPAVVYFIQGMDTVTSGDGTTRTFKPGDTTSATKVTSHWHQNKGNEPVLLLAVDVFHPKK